MKVEKKCMCGTVTKIEVDPKRYAAWQAGALIQYAFAKMHPMYRECLINGMCMECQEKFYNTPAPGNEGKFGKFLGHCACCDRAVWEKDLNADGTWSCSSCGEIIYEKDEK